MPTALPPNKKLRRLVDVPFKRIYLPFDITMTSKGLTFRRADVTNRKKLFAPWHVVLQNVRDESKGYRLFSIEEAFGHLADDTPNPYACPLCKHDPTEPPPKKRSVK